jgi:hypothetical protein
MTRRADPKRIFQAWRAAIRANLTGSGMAPEPQPRPRCGAQVPSE